MLKSNSRAVQEAHNALGEDDAQQQQQQREEVGFPLAIEAEEVEVIESEFVPQFIVNMLPKLSWSALYSAAASLGHCDDLPLEFTAEMADDESFLRAVHHTLLDVHVQKGALVCPLTGRRYPIVGGIPNMLLHEDEV
jgi:multifunctional methyltransferase subunit TRM112